MDRIAKLFDQSVHNVTGKITSTVSNIKRDFTRRSKRRKQAKKDKKQKKLIKSDANLGLDVDHKYRLTCDLPSCEYHPKNKNYEDFLNTLWCPKSQRNSIHSSQIIDIDLDNKKSDSNLSIEKSNKENLLDNKFDNLNDKLTKLNYLNDDQLSESSTDNEENLNDKNIRLTITNENGETYVEGGDNCMICFNKLKNPLEIMLCQHSFHKKCIIMWLSVKNTCPLCCTKIENVEKYK